MKNFTVLLTIAAMPLLSFSQNNNDIIPSKPIEQSKISIGAIGSFGHSFIVPYNNYRFNSSVAGGISLVYSPWVHWGISLSGLYSSEGSTVASGDLRNAVSLDYLRVPLNAVYFFKKYENDFRPKISFGPTFGFLTHEVNSSNAATLDVGANIAAGFNYRLSRAVWLSADVNYYQGLTDIYSAGSDKEMNGNVRINIGLSFGFD